MTNIWILKIFLAANLVAFVLAETPEEAFTELRDETFGMNYDRLQAWTVEDNIHKMIELIKGGRIPAEVQGQQTLEYLESLVSDKIKREVCILDEDLAEITRLKELGTGMESIHKYLNNCIRLILKRCATNIHNIVKQRLGKIDEKGWRALDDFATGVMKSSTVFKPNYFTFRMDWDANPQLHVEILKVLKSLDPDGSKMILKRWTHKKKSLREFMEQIRSPCVTFLENVDPLVDLYPVPERLFPSNNPRDVLPRWHSYKKVCQKIVQDWEKIVKDAYVEHERYLKNPKAPRAHFWSDCFMGDGEDGGESGGTFTKLAFWSGR